jgi:hypothetical protein
MYAVITTVVAWILLGISVMAICRMLLDRHLLVLLYGRSRYHACRAVTSMLGLRSQRILSQRAFKWLLFLIGAVALAEHLQHSENPWRNLGDIWLPMLALMIGCVQFFGQMRPAAILVLGNGRRAVTLQEITSDALFPHRTVSLLEIGKEVRAPGDCFRVTFGDWKDTVWQLARSVLVIIVDMRKVTPAVDEELDFILRERLQYKTILLKSTDQPLPKESLSECSIVETEDQCLAKVKHAFQSSMTLPSDHRPIRNDLA